MRTCEAYAGQGLDVTLVALRMRRPDAVADDQLWDHFGIERRFRVRTIWTPLTHDASVRAFRLWGGGVGVRLAFETYAHAAADRQHRPIVHARAPVMLAPFVGTRSLVPRSRRPALVFETHALPTAANGWITRGSDLVVVNSRKLRSEICERFGLDGDRVLYAPLPAHNSVKPVEKASARSTLGLEAGPAIACYTGKLTRELSEFLLQTARVAAGQIPEFRLLLVGGNPDVVGWTRSRVAALGLNDVVLVAGFVAPRDVGLYQSAADVLVYHLPESVGIFAYTTPAKAYEYQAMERPIIATDFPLFHEVFGDDGERAIRVLDRTPDGLAHGIASALRLPDGGRAMFERAIAFVKTRTWETRTKTVTEALGM
jgi:glycosyltransferase involved in cell wall biosynthesis